MKKFIVFLFICLFLQLVAFAEKKIVILGFDGVDFKLLKLWIKEGKLPSLKSLASQGTFKPLETTKPAQSPVAWSTFATGKNPAKHRILGFLKKKKNSYVPQLGLATVEKKPVLGGNIGRFAISIGIGILISLILYAILSAIKINKLKKYTFCIFILIISFSFIQIVTNKYIPKFLPYPVSLKQGPSFWTIAGENNIKTTVLMAPISFPAEKVKNGRLLCGFGVPDIAATNGLWFFYSEKYKNIIPTETGGFKMPINSKSHEYSAEILGPTNIMLQYEEESIKKKLTKTKDLNEIKKLQNRIFYIKKNKILKTNIKILKNKESINLYIGNEKKQISKGNWSNWITIIFRLTPLVNLTGMVRIKLTSLNPIEFYMTPIQFHPNHLPPNVKLSFPENFIRDLAKDIGLFPTLGWAVATNPLKDDVIDEETFWEDAEYTFNSRSDILYSSFNKKNWQLFISAFYVTDRISHMYWRFIDKKSPRYKQDSIKYPKYKNNLLKTYQKMDSLVGDVYKRIDSEKDIFIVMSDHGFAPFRYEVNLNTWLLKNGYLKLKKMPASRMQVIDLFRGKKLLSHIDWTETKAYSIGLGKIYINLKGRDPNGFIEQNEYKIICKEIKNKLLKLQHGKNKVVDVVHLKNEIYNGPYLEECPDLLVGFNIGYRIAWQSSLGGISKNIIEVNNLKWSGDHCSVSSRLIPGIFLCNKKIEQKNINIADIAPTILKLLNVPIPEDMDGKILKVIK